jgi:hypothetical protein
LVDKVYKQRKSGPTVIVMGWCPAKNKAIALQVDENGRLVIDPEELDTRYLKLDGSNDLASVLNFPNMLLKEITATDLGIRNKADTGFYNFQVGNVIVRNANSGVIWYTDTGVLKTWYSGASNKIDLQGRDIGASAYETVARIQSHATQPYFEILASHSLIPHTTNVPNLGSVSKYWNQAFIDAIICSDSIDLDPTPGDAVIYFNHDGAANEASLRYDKVNKRLELWIDGAIVGYCNDALGWVNGPP